MMCYERAIEELRTFQRRIASEDEDVSIEQFPIQALIDALEILDIRTDGAR
jgi:hypothetical protein